MARTDDTEPKIAHIAPFGLRMFPELKHRVERGDKSEWPLLEL